MNIEKVVQSYIGAALWSTIDDDVYQDGAGPDDRLDQLYDESDIATVAMASIRCDCARLVAKADSLGLVAEYENAGGGWSESAESQFGYDFWMTRSGSGVGFWDRENLPDGLGDKLTALCDAFGVSDIFAGDDGKLYVSPVSAPAVLS